MFGLLAAATFGAGAPCAKLLLGNSSPLALAGVLYLGAGIGLTLFRIVSRGVAPGWSREAPLRRADLGLLAAIALTGGLAGPLLMLLGLARLSGVAGALLLNLEAPLTMLIAVAIFGEAMSVRALGGAALIIGASLLLGYEPGPLRSTSAGTLCLTGACACWALDNNLTQRLSLRDPLSIVQVKTLAAGALSLVLALITGATLAPKGAIAAALLLGSVSYGFSVVLDTYALRLLGAAREAAFFATAPFAGAIVAIPLLGEYPNWKQGLAALLMGAGLAAMLHERHQHLHTHEAIEHDHLHVHDEHHRHQHEPSIAEAHSHRHSHDPITHDHSHLSDLHHRHRHQA